MARQGRHRYKKAKSRNETTNTTTEGDSSINLSTPTENGCKPLANKDPNEYFLMDKTTSKKAAQSKELDSNAAAPSDTPKGRKHRGKWSVPLEHLALASTNKPSEAARPVAAATNTLPVTDTNLNPADKRKKKQKKTPRTTQISNAESNLASDNISPASTIVARSTSSDHARPNTYPSVSNTGSANMKNVTGMNPGQGVRRGPARKFQGPKTALAYPSERRQNGQPQPRETGPGPARGTMANEPERKATAEHCESFATIADLPDEILESIFEMAFHNPNYMEVNEWFRSITGRCLRVPDDVNRSILYLRQNDNDPFRFYRIGLPALYKANTWVLPLNFYRYWDEYSNKDRWGKGAFALPGEKIGILPTPTVAKYVKSLVLHQRDGGSWTNAVHILRPLQNLEEVMFDVRCEYARYDGVGETMLVDAPEDIKDILKMKGIPATGGSLKRVSLIHDTKSMNQEGSVTQLTKWLRLEHEPDLEAEKAWGAKWY